MDSLPDKKRTNVEVDRLSSLPDDVIHKILSFAGLKRAIETSVLSPRWRYIWTSSPYLDFSSDGPCNLAKFSQFVTHVLSKRNNLSDVFSIKLSFRGDFTQEYVKQIMNYAFTHNIQQLNIACTGYDNVDFPRSFFSSKSLEHLSLSSFSISQRATSTWELPALTTLHLNDITLCRVEDNTDNCIGFFSKCANLKNLILKSCSTKEFNGLSIGNPLLSDLTLDGKEFNGLSICNPLLSDLTLDGVGGRLKFVMVVAPKLKNLTIKNCWEPEYLISAPELASLLYSGHLPLQLSTEGFPSLEKVDLCVSAARCVSAHKIICLLQQLRSVKSLTLNLEIVKHLCSSVEIISHQPCPFANLTSLKIYPEKVSEWESPNEEVTLSTEIKNFFLHNSPSATFTMVTHEEIRAMRNAKSAQVLMTKFRARLEQQKAQIETELFQMEQVKAKIMTQDASQLQMKRVNKCWENMSEQIEKWKSKIDDIISELKEIKELLKKVSKSKKAELEACFSRLCAEADNVVNKMIDHMNLQCNTSRSCFSIYFHELASTSQSSS